MTTFLRLDIRLRGVDDPPWRQVLLRPTATFQDLHDTIQDACGWEDCHLFAFRPVPDLRALPIACSPHDDGREGPIADRVKLRGFLAAAGDRVVYEYDFGDSWEHDVRVLEVVDERGARFRRRLLSGELSFPPEDCGGVGGYLECVRVAEGGEDPDGLRDWLDGWTPAGFDLEATRREFDS